MWIMAILALLAIGIAFRMSLELKLIKFDTNRLKAGYIAKGGINYFLSELEKDKNGYDALNETWSNGFDIVSEKLIFKDISLTDGANSSVGTFTISYISGINEDGINQYFYGAMDEERKININKASLEILKKLFPDPIATYVDNWRSGSASSGDEEYYGIPERPYKQKHKPFDSIEELMMVRDMTPEVFLSVKDKVTVFGDGLVNLNTTNADVLKILFQSAGAEEAVAGELAAAMVNYRRNNSDDGDASNRIFSSVPANAADIGIDPSFQAFYAGITPNLKVKSDFYKIRSTGFVYNTKIKKIATAVVKKGEPDKVLSYTEE